MGVIDFCVRGGGWRMLRWWKGANERYPDLGAEVRVHMPTGRCAFIVIGPVGVIWSCPASHPVTWNLTPAEEYELVSKYIQKAVESIQRRQAAASSETLTWAGAHPALWEYLTVDAFDDGAPREVSMLLVFVEDGRFKVALQDRQEGQSLWATAESLGAALGALESHLRAGTGDWRRMRGQQGKKGGKR